MARFKLLFYFYFKWNLSKSDWLGIHNRKVETMYNDDRSNVYLYDGLYLVVLMMPKIAVHDDVHKWCGNTSTVTCINTSISLLMQQAKTYIGNSSSILTSKHFKGWVSLSTCHVTSAPSVCTTPSTCWTRIFSCEVLQDLSVRTEVDKRVFHVPNRALLDSESYFIRHGCE